jgi:hypothetical protein
MRNRKQKKQKIRTHSIIDSRVATPDASALCSVASVIYLSFSPSARPSNVRIASCFRAFHSVNRAPLPTSFAVGSSEVHDGLVSSAYNSAGLAFLRPNRGLLVKVDEEALPSLGFVFLIYR